MNAPTLEDLARQAAAGDTTATERFFNNLQDVFRLLNPSLLSRVVQSAEALQDGPPRSWTLEVIRLSPEQLEAERQDLNMEEIEANLREIKEKGGLSLKDFLPEIERSLRRS